MLNIERQIIWQINNELTRSLKEGIVAYSKNYSNIYLNGNHEQS
jgi:hypothetical protein